MVTQENGLRLSSEALQNLDFLVSESDRTCPCCKFVCPTLWWSESVIHTYWKQNTQEQLVVCVAVAHQGDVVLKVTHLKLSRQLCGVGWLGALNLLLVW